MADFPTDLNHGDDGPQTVYDGRRWKVEIELLLAGDYTEQQVKQGIEWTLGGGSIANDHPLIDGDYRSVSVSYARATREHRFTDWNAKNEDGIRTGRGRWEVSA